MMITTVTAMREATTATAITQASGPLLATSVTLVVDSVLAVVDGAAVVVTLPAV